MPRVCGVGVIISTLAPIFMLIALGLCLARAGFLADDFLRGLNRFIYWVALPCMLFTSSAEGGYHFDGAGRILLVMVIATIPAVALINLCARLADWSPGMHGTLMHVAMRGNLSYIGLPVLLFLAADPHLVGHEGLRSLAVKAFAPCMLFQNIVGIAELLIGKQSSWRGTARVVLKGIVTNPLLLAVAGGLLLSWSGWIPPLAVTRSLLSVGGIAAPLALIGIGGALASARLRGRWQPPLLAAMFKVGIVPLAGLLACRALGLTPTEQCVAMVFLATPTAAASYPMIVEMGGDEMCASTAIFMSTALSVFSLTAALALV